MHLLISKRIRTFKVLRQLGISNATLILASIAEMLILSVLATVVGVLLGIHIANWLSPAVNQTLASLYSVNIGQGDLSLATVFLQSLGACLLGSLIASALPLYRINQNLSIASHANLTSLSVHFWLTLAGFFLCMAGVLLLVTSHLLWSFVSIALFIFAGCFAILALLPKSLAALQSRVSRRLPVLHWSLADASRISHRSSVALCAFFIAVAANIGMNLMVDSFRQATNEWLTQRLDADAYVYAQDTAKVKAWLNLQHPHLEALMRRTDLGSYNGEKVQIRSFPMAAERQKTMVFDDALPDVWRTFSAKQSVLINQQFAFSKKIQLGDELVINRTSGDDIALTVAGIYLDYGNPQLQILVPPDRILSNSNERQILAIYTNQSTLEQLVDIKNQVNQAFPQANVALSHELIALSMLTFDRTFVITAALNLITLLVAAFSLATSVVIIDQDNSPQRALMKSLGVTSSSLLVMSVLQYGLLCLFICLLAIPFGIGLSWLLINVVNVQAFFWSYPLSFQTSALIEVVLFSLGIIVAVIALPAVKSSKTSLSQDIKWLEV
ncbi:ABC transporter permease [Aliiglaciecola litoralis]|uniref:ABC3 transporter permease C-terminal domain-containing protein n=1 Tax=Aliiglaciecola litoralis TaxID=582857 RepID=A0ABP3WXD0_9ALTE